ncbi:MAG TPA: alanine--tRNA ligase-related protein [Patescibacteria group bacterium]|nr:alanine--tRNA ligase-related protein [Patescibacteria group bacterium]
MTGNEVRKKYLEFFEKRGHKIIKPAPLVLKDDPTTLFTSAGMQPLVPYLLGKAHDEGKRLTDSQPCFRSQDIEEVGDNRHDTLFEMLGNWSLGDYFKKEQIPWIWEFIIKELGLNPENIHVTLYEGNESVPKDEETYKLWRELGISDERIHYYKNKNWWSISGPPENMRDGEVGGPDSEIFFEFENVKHDPKYGKECHPNCDCGRFLEIGNSVFIQYKKVDGKLVELPNKNVDFGGGLERLTAATSNDPDIFKSDLFWPVIEKIEELSGKKYEDYQSSMRIITDHIKASTFLIANGVTPSNKLQGYVLRRLLRRAALQMRNLNIDLSQKDFNEMFVIVEKVFDIYSLYLDKKDLVKVQAEITSELEKFGRALENGVKRINKTDIKDIDEKFAFDLMQSEGFPFEITQELVGKKGVNLDKNKFEEMLREHQELSRKSSEDKFKIK